jgi:Trk-type K+ transport system membrane component
MTMKVSSVKPKASLNLCTQTRWLGGMVFNTESIGLAASATDFEEREVRKGIPGL